MPGVYIIEAAKDELVPASHGLRLLESCSKQGFPTRSYKVRGALHNDASVRQEGKVAIAASILDAITAAERRRAADAATHQEEKSSTST